MINEITDKFEKTINTGFKQQVNSHLESFKALLNKNYDLQFVVAYYGFLFDHYLHATSLLVSDCAGIFGQSDYTKYRLIGLFFKEETDCYSKSAYLNKELIGLNKTIPTFDDCATAFCMFLYKTISLNETEYGSIFLLTKDIAKQVKEFILSLEDEFYKYRYIITTSFAVPNEEFYINRAYYELEGSLEDAKESEASENDKTLIIEYLENALEIETLNSSHKAVFKGIGEMVYNSAIQLNELAEKRMLDFNEALPNEHKTDLYHWIRILLRCIGTKDIDIATREESFKQEKDIICEEYSDNQEILKFIKLLKEDKNSDVTICDTVYTYYSFLWNNYAERFNKNPKVCGFVVFSMVISGGAYEPTEDNPDLNNAITCCIGGLAIDFDNNEKVLDFGELIPKDYVETKHEWFIYIASIAIKLWNNFFFSGNTNVQDVFNEAKDMFDTIVSISTGERNSERANLLLNELDNNKYKIEENLEEYIMTANETIDKLAKS